MSPSSWVSSIFSKRKSVGFEAAVSVHELTNVPYVSGMYFIKWKLKSGGNAVGLTNRVTINQYTIHFNSSFSVLAAINIGADGTLLPCELQLSIVQQVDERSTTLGRCIINLSEYAGSREMSRRYLLQDSKINALVRVTISMVQTRGDPVFKVPPFSLQSTNTPIPIPVISVVSPIEHATLRRSKSIESGVAHAQGVRRNSKNSSKFMDELLGDKRLMDSELDNNGEILSDPDAIIDKIFDDAANQAFNAKT